MRILITGITGFAGSHLAEYVLAEHPGVRVFGLVRWRSRMDNIVQIRDKVELHEADLKDIISLKKALADIKPTGSSIWPPRASSPPPGNCRSRHSPSTPSARSTSLKRS